MSGRMAINWGHADAEMRLLLLCEFSCDLCFFAGKILGFSVRGPGCVGRGWGGGIVLVKFF